MFHKRKKKNTKSEMTLFSFHLCFSKKLSIIREPASSNRLLHLLYTFHVGQSLNIVTLLKTLKHSKLPIKRKLYNKATDFLTCLKISHDIEIQRLNSSSSLGQ